MVCVARLRLSTALRIKHYTYYLRVPSCKHENPFSKPHNSQLIKVLVYKIRSKNMTFWNYPSKSILYP